MEQKSFSFAIPADKVPESKRRIGDRESFFKEANAHNAKAIAYRKEKKYWDALLEDALFFHEMRKCEQYMHEDRLNDLKKAFDMGIFNPDQYIDEIQKSVDFLNSWSDRERALHTMRTSLTRLKFSDTAKIELADAVVKWSFESGMKDTIEFVIEGFRKDHQMDE